MQLSPTSNYSWFNDLGIIKQGKRFLRKGLVGDWKNHLSEDQVDRFVKEIEIPLIDLAEHHNPVEPPPNPTKKKWTLSLPSCDS